MKKTIKSKMFIGAAIFLALLLTGCSSPAGGGNSGENQGYTDYSVSDIDANSLYYIHKDSQNKSITENPDWNINYYGYAELIDEDPVFAQFPQYGDALIDTHGKVYKIATHKIDLNDKGEEVLFYCNSYMTIDGINVSEESALSFDYKCDLLNYTGPEGSYINYFMVFVDGSQNLVFKKTGNYQMWQNQSIILTPGTHSVDFVVYTETTYSGNGITNAVYIDNITLSSNVVDTVEIYPKGLQETYVNGDKIQFSAKALRSDGSIISGKDITWTTTGGNIDDNGLFTPGSTSGTFTITATIDGKTASNETVKVHGSNYLTEPVTINGHTFTGKINPIDYTYRTNTNKITFMDPTPKYSNFTTDGFFVLKGTAKNTCAFVRVVKLDDDDSTDKEFGWDYKYNNYYIIKPGDFEQRIWLRFGDGDYEILVYEATVNFYKDYDGYEGAFNDANWPGPDEPGSYTWFHVRNQTTFNHSADDCTYLLPSYYIQCDDFLITNAFNSVMAELPANATLGQKLRAFYDWEAKRSHYDSVSFTDKSTDKRKRQDAVHVLKYGMCVCEGYADLYTAFARLLGVKSAYQSSANLCHAWTELSYKDEWKMVDITWDDPSANMSTDKNPTAENYWYFLIDPADASHAKRDSEGNTIKPYQYDRVTDYSRSAN